jgi:hypothetical protein
MKLSKWKLRSRYGKTHASKGTSIRTVKHATRLDQYDTAFPDDRIEVGGEAGNSAFLIAHRMLRHGEGWKTLGPFATVAKSALRSKR